ncbi:MAG: hypothetical protein AAF518_07170 [Spirochaetota bacterium]
MFEYFSFETAKRGFEFGKTEDSLSIQQVDTGKLLVTLSDGASTGVFSKNWSKHIVESIAQEHVISKESFAAQLTQIRKTFQPTITRPSALRKFLQEGSYATVASVLFESISSEEKQGMLKLHMLSIGDIELLGIRPDGSLDFSFPYQSSQEFGNVPDLLRSNEKLQIKTPLTIRESECISSQQNTILLCTDAASEFFLKRLEEYGQIKDILTSILHCQTQWEFTDLMDEYRSNYGMKNDDVAIFLLRKRSHVAAVEVTSNEVPIS